MEQADAYAQKIQDAVTRIAAAPREARRHPRWRNYHRLSVEDHFVFVQVRDDGVRVARILHKRMDAGRHLS